MDSIHGFPDTDIMWIKCGAGHDHSYQIGGFETIPDCPICKELSFIPVNEDIPEDGEYLVKGDRFYGIDVLRNGRWLMRQEQYDASDAGVTAYFPISRIGGAK